MEKRNQKGFTLIELLIVVAIIGLLATLAIVSLNTARQKANDTKRIADLKSMQTALELYWNGEGDGSYPTSADWDTLETDLDTYLPALPVDPDSSQAYTYVHESTGDDYLLQATLQDSSHSALASDATGVADNTASYSSVSSDDTEVATVTVTGDICPDGSGVYCLISVER